MSDITKKTTGIPVKVSGFASYGNDVGTFLLKANMKLLSSERVSVDLTKLNEDYLVKFVENCFNKCERILVTGYLYVSSSSSVLVAKTLEALSPNAGITSDASASSIAQSEDSMSANANQICQQIDLNPQDKGFCQCVETNLGNDGNVAELLSWINETKPAGKSFPEWVVERYFQLQAEGKQEDVDWEKRVKPLGQEKGEKFLQCMALS